MGFFMVPDNGVWNYHFMGVNFNENVKYGLVIETPRDFYHELQRPSHFTRFVGSSEGGEEVQPMQDDEIQGEDIFG